MKVGQRVRTKYKNRFGYILEVHYFEDLLPEVTVQLDDGSQWIFYEAELEIVDESAS